MTGRRLSGIALSLALLALPAVAPGVARASSPPAATVKAKLNAIRARIAAERQLQALHQAQASAAYGQFEQAMRSLNAADTTLGALGARLATLRDDEAQSRASLAAAQNTAATAARRLAATERSWQEEGALGPWSSLFTARSLSQFFTRLYLVNQVIAYQGNQIRVLAAAVARADAQTRALGAQAAGVMRAEAAARTQAARIQAAGQAERAAVGQDRALAAADASALDRLEEASSSLVAILEQERGASTAPAVSVGKSLDNIHFIWPVVGPITSPFGMRVDPVTHEYWLHTGMDIGVPEGTPVHAACAGTILYAGWMTGYGNTVIIDCGGGISTLYAHAETLEVHVGEAVTQGEEIDLAGMTGWATGPHVHFEIRIDGKPVNPAPYLPGG